MHRNDLENYLNQLLDIARFHDYCPNGLQVEGRNDICNIVSGVTASLDLIKAAIEAKADTILVHHGYFWRGEDARITGMKGQRIRLLMEHNINLFAYHLPLDDHPELGNNAQLGQRLGFTETARFGEHNLAVLGQLANPVSLTDLKTRINQTLAREPLIVGGDPDKQIQTIAWCTGGAQSYFEAAIPLGIDAYLTGEISEQNTHTARESGVAFIAAGHHATERYGVQALGHHIAQQFDVSHQFIDMDNPV